VEVASFDFTEFLSIVAPREKDVEVKSVLHIDHVEPGYSVAVDEQVNIHRRIGLVEVDWMGRQIGLIRVLPERYGRTGDSDYSDLREPGAPAAHPSQYAPVKDFAASRVYVRTFKSRPSRGAAWNLEKKTRIGTVARYNRTHTSCAMPA
jgi:hypothetical protein